MTSTQFYAKTVQNDGAIIQLLKANFGNTQNRLPDCIVLVKYTHIEIVTLKAGQPYKDEPITIQMPIISCSIIEADYKKFKTDLLLVISQTLEVFIMQPMGTIQQLEFQTLKSFNLIEYLQNDKQFKIPFQRRMAPVIASFSFENLRVVTLAYKETEMLLQQLCFIVMDINSLGINLGTVGTYPQQMNMTTLITDIMYHPGLNRSSKDVPMMPQLGIFAMYSNKYLTYDLLYTSIFSSHEKEQIQWCEEGVMLTEGPMVVSNISDFSITYAFEDEDMTVLFPYLVVGIERIQLIYNLDQIASFDIYDHKDIQLKPMARPLAVTQIYGLKFIATYDDGTLILIDICFNFDQEPNEQSSHDASQASWQYQPVYIKAKSLEFPLLPDSRYLRFPSTTSIVCLPYKHDNKQEFTYYIFLGSQSVDCLMLKFEQNETLKFVSQSFNSCIGSVQAINVYKNSRFIICTSQGRDGSILTGRFGLPAEVYAQHFVPRNVKTSPQQDTRIMTCVSISNVNEPELFIHVSQSFTDFPDGINDELKLSSLKNPQKNGVMPSVGGGDLLVFISDAERTITYLLCDKRSRIKNLSHQEPYCQLFTNISILYAARTLDGRLVLATRSYVQISGGPRHVYNIKYVQLISNTLIIQTVTGKIQFLEVSEGGQGDFKPMQDANSDYFKLPELLDFQAQETADGIVTLAVGADSQLHMLMVSGTSVRKYQTVAFGISFQKVTFYVSNHTLVVLCSYNSDVYFYQLGMNLSVISQKQIMSGHNLVQLFAGSNEAFVKSEYSVYKLSILKDTPRLLPILTQPLNNIQLACLCPEMLSMSHKKAGKLKNIQEPAAQPGVQLYQSFGAQYVASIKTERQQGLILLADGAVNTVHQTPSINEHGHHQAEDYQRDLKNEILALNKDNNQSLPDFSAMQQRKRAYSLMPSIPTLDIDSDDEALVEQENQSEVPSSLVDFLIYCNVGNAPQFAYRRQFLRRTPTRICYSKSLKVIAVQTEKYLGMQQIRIYVDQRYVQSEVLKLLPETSICTHMQFVTIGGKEYLAVALVSTMDIYQELQGLENVSGDQEKEAQTWDTRLEIYEICASEKRANLISDLHLDSSQPINYFIQDGDQLLLSVECQLLVVSASLPLKVIQTVNFEPSMSQFIKFYKNQYLAIMSRQVTVLNSKFQVVKSMKPVLDARQIGNLTDNIYYCISSDTVVTIFDQNLQIQGQLKVDYNITSHFAHNGRLYIGTDTGAVMVFIQNKFDILRYLQNEIIQQLNLNNTFQAEYEQLNILNGDILQHYLEFDQKTQDTIAFRLNTNTSHLNTVLREITFQLGE